MHGIGHLDKTTLTGLLEQISDHTIVYQQNFEVNYIHLVEIFSLHLDNTLTNLSKGYELYQHFVGLAFAFSLDLDIDKDDYPVLRPLMFPLSESEEKLASCYLKLQHFLVTTQPSTTGTMTIQTETEDQETQDNTTHTPSDTTRDPMAYPDTKPDFEHDPELYSEDQNILAIETTDTLDNSIDNSDPTFDNEHNRSINDCTDIKPTVDNSDIGDPTESKTETIDDNMHDQTDNMDNEDQDNSEITQTDNNTLDFNSPIDLNDHNSSMKTQAGTDNSHKESEPIEGEDESDPRSFEPESIDIDSDVDSECDFDELEAIYLDMCKNFRTKIPARKPIPLFYFG